MGESELNASRQWKSGSKPRKQMSLTEQLRDLPSHRFPLDGHGVYHERKRLKSKYYGVRWHQRRNADGEWREGRWSVGIEVNGEYHYGGEFREENEIYAAAAYDDLVKRLGLCRPLNLPSGFQGELIAAKG